MKKASFFISSSDPTEQHGEFYKEHIPFMNPEINKNVKISQPAQSV